MAGSVIFIFMQIERDKKKNLFLERERERGCVFFVKFVVNVGVGVGGVGA